MRGSKARRATIRDMKAVGLCMKGCRRFFLRRGYDWAEIRAHGVSVEELRATGDANAKRVADYVEKLNG